MVPDPAAAGPGRDKAREAAVKAADKARAVAVAGAAVARVTRDQVDLLRHPRVSGTETDPIVNHRKGGVQHARI